MTSATPLYDALTALSFGHKDVVRSTQSFKMHPIPTLYSEPEAPTRARWSWADGRITPVPTHRYLFDNSTSDATQTCMANASVPPLGMRSAPPLGGLASGTVELRADGTLQAWTIENASPAGSTKLSLLDDAVIGVRVAGASRLLRTHPPQDLPGVATIEFSGAMPHTRLTPLDDAFPPGLRLRLFGRSRWRVGDMAGSATPALAFTLTTTNPSPVEPLPLALFFSLPLSLQRGISRAPGTGSGSTSTSGSGARAGAGGGGGGGATVESCYAACSVNVSCAAWHFGPSEGCITYAGADAVPPARNAVEQGVASGARQLVFHMGMGMASAPGDTAPPSPSMRAHGPGGSGGAVHPHPRALGSFPLKTGTRLVAVRAASGLFNPPPQRHAGHLRQRLAVRLSGGQRRLGRRLSRGECRHGSLAVGAVV